ncbi:MAG: protease, partial [Bacteroidota bacterium]
IQKMNVEDNEATVYAKGINEAVASSNGEHILWRKGGSWSLSAASGKPSDEDGISTAAKVKVNPQAEYAQILKEGWRHMRDFLYVDNVHGAPWDQVYEWYSPMVKHIRHRTDLNYVIDLLSGEVAVGHSYVGGGDMPDLDYVPVGLLLTVQ